MSTAEGHCDHCADTCPLRLSAPLLGSSVYHLGDGGRALWIDGACTACAEVERIARGET